MRRRGFKRPLILELQSSPHRHERSLSASRPLHRLSSDTVSVTVGSHWIQLLPLLLPPAAAGGGGGGTETKGVAAIIKPATETDTAGGPLTRLAGWQIHKSQEYPCTDCQTHTKRVLNRSSVSPAHPPRPGSRMHGKVTTYIYNLPTGLRIGTHQARPRPLSGQICPQEALGWTPLGAELGEGWARCGGEGGCYGIEIVRISATFVAPANFRTGRWSRSRLRIYLRS